MTPILSFTTDAIRSRLRESRQKSNTRKALEQATRYDEYADAATILDSLEGGNDWKCEAASDEYDYTLIDARLKQFREARLAKDAEKVLFLLRTTLSRNLGDMGNPALYEYTHVGTKVLIDSYINEVQLSFGFLLESHSLSTQDVLNSLLMTRQSFGRTALLLSGGGTLAMSHIGIVKELFEQKLLPRIISGSSAGAIIASVVCSSTNEEIPKLIQEFAFGNLDVFEDSKAPESYLMRLGRFLKFGVVMDIGYLRGVMQEWLGDMTFHEAFNRTRRILNISVSSSSIYEMPRLLNYITAPNVIVWSAVAASCSLPLVFAGSPLMAKDPRTGSPMPWDLGSSKYIDGSIEGDLPTTRLSELFNVNHFIVSQVNPHVQPFLSKSSEGLIRGGGLLANLVIGELLHATTLLTALGIAPALAQKISGLLSQRYTGHITILPHAPLFQGLARLLTNPTPAFMLTACERGQRATWSRMSIIRNHCQIELSLDDALYALRLDLIQKERPTRYLKYSMSQQFDQSKRARTRRSSIVSNASAELDPADIAPPRSGMKSQPTTPGIDRKIFYFDRTESLTAKTDTSTKPLRIVSRRGSLHFLDGTPRKEAFELFPTVQLFAPITTTTSVQSPCEERDYLSMSRKEGREHLTIDVKSPRLAKSPRSPAWPRDDILRIP